MTITAKYNGECVLCNGRILSGDEIVWEKGEGAAHASCAEGDDPPPDRG